MLKLNSMVAAPAMVMLLSGTAHAALTADQIWASWQKGGSYIGLEVSSATEVKSEGVLTLNGVRFQDAMAQGALTLSDLTMSEQSDGTVVITPGAAIALEGDAQVQLDMSHEDLLIVAFENAEGGIEYKLTAESLVANYKTSLESLSPGAQPSVSQGNIALSGLSAFYADIPGDTRSYLFGLTASESVQRDETVDPDLQSRTVSENTSSDFQFGLELVLPSNMDLAADGPEALTQALNDGFKLTFMGKQGEGYGKVLIEDASLPAEITYSTKPSSFDFSLSKANMALALQGEGFEAKVSSPLLTDTAEVWSENLGFGFTLPVVTGDVAEDYALFAQIKEFTLGDAIWDLADPEGNLSRDAINLNIDLSGKTTMNLVESGVNAAMGSMSDMPVVESLNLNEIFLALGGAELKADGAFTFDNSMGIPLPLGEANVLLSGASKLLEGMIATGWLTEDDAMGAQMMMGMFMVPGQGEDVLTSKIEAKEGMSLFVNGQQIQ